MMKKVYLLLILGMFLGSCDFFDLDLTESPNSLKPSDANVDYILNNIQINLVYLLNDNDPANWKGFNALGMEMTRMTNMFGPTYLIGYAPTNYDKLWSTAYSELLMDSKTLIPVATERGLTDHTGMTKIIDAYVLMTVVDFWGDVPYTDALQGSDNFNPGLTPGEDIYDAALTLLDDGIADCEAGASFGVATDLFYDGDMTKWITLAKTLKLKLYLNLRLIHPDVATTNINALIAEGDLIDSPEEDFVFNYSNTAVNPDSRHPYFTYNYLNGANDYMSNYFMWCLYAEKTVIDPRIRYYFYRQVSNVPNDINAVPCLNASKPAWYTPEMPFCALSEGYWGRDHLDGDGIPPDTRGRTLYGLYPAGGKFDANQGTEGTATSGALGAGMEPIILTSFVQFMQAESALTLGTTGDPRTLLANAVRSSISKVMGFQTGFVNAAYVPSATEVDNYVAEVLNLYDAAGSDAERLDVIAKEYYIALFGNGIETYNLVRRTTYPSNLQPALVATPGPFFRTIYYSANFANLNSSISQKTGPVQVFWDNNPAGAIQ